MNIGILSDSHGDTQSLAALIEQMPKLDALCFLGDIASDATYIEEHIAKSGRQIAFYAVRGNNDYYASAPDQITLDLCGKKILMVHGHLQRVKSDLMTLCYRAQELNADVALFGHTHRQYCAYDYGVLMINPGASGCARYGGQRASAAVLQISSNGSMKVKQISI